MHTAGCEFRTKNKSLIDADVTNANGKPLTTDN